MREVNFPIFHFEYTDMTFNLCLEKLKYGTVYLFHCGVQVLKISLLKSNSEKHQQNVELKEFCFSI